MAVTSTAQLFSLPVGTAATLACIYEATAPKPGNVHPGASFDDVDYADFISSAVIIGPILQQARVAGVGKTVFDAMRATRDTVGTNTNLGTLLLISPLAAVPTEQPLADGVNGVLAQLTDADTRLVYEAIRISGAGGLGRAPAADVSADAPANLNLVGAMRLAAERDLVARQYVNSFADVFGGPAAWIAEGLSRGWPLSAAVVHAHVRQLASCADSLIGRKCGDEVAAQAREFAALTLEAGVPGDSSYERALATLDAWLRADGHRRNPGTTADLVAAGLFVLLREGRLDWSVW